MNGALFAVLHCSFTSPSRPLTARGYRDRVAGRVTSSNFTAPIATLGARGNLGELLLHPNCAQIAQVGFCNFPFAATSRTSVKEVSPTARVLTPEKASRPSSVRTWPGGISRNRQQPNSVRTVVASCQRTPCAMLFAKSCEMASAVRKALPVTLPT